jgi:uncharacterized membrane protein YdjX (TVP38/TMEM64 family)
MKQKIKDALPLILLGSFAALCFITLNLTGVVENFDVPGWSAWILEQGWVGALLYIIAYILRPLIFFPATVLTLFGGYTFGAFYGTIYDIIGAGTGAVLAFWIARRFGRGSVEKLLRGKRWQTFDERAEKHGLTAVLFMRLIPLFPFDGINYGAGLSNIRLRDYTIATYVGIIPGAIVYNNFGASLHHIGSKQFYIALSIYAAFALFPLIYRWVKKNKTTEEGV